jgi:hypothetical protein
MTLMRKWPPFLVTRVFDPFLFQASQTRSLLAPTKSICIAVQRVAVSEDPTRETFLSSSMVAFCGLGMSKGPAMHLNMAHCDVKA